MATAADIQGAFGDKIQNPLGEGGAFPGSYGDVGGMTLLISNVIKFAVVVAGIFTLINLIIAGYIYITGGDNPKMTQQAWQKIYMSLLGLAIMAGAFAITAIVSYILFGDPGVILNPKIYGPGA